MMDPVEKNRYAPPGEYIKDHITHYGQNYFSGVFGCDGQLKLGFTRFEWTDVFFKLANE